MPAVDHSKCTGCDICGKKCPIWNKVLECYAAWADDTIREKSSSGGAFTVFAQYVIGNGGVVFGAAWTDDLFVKHKYIESMDDIDELRRSKYAQSETGDSFKQAKEFLDSGRQVLFVGTPCQIAGLNSFLGRKYDNLITMDFICYNAPSVYSIRKYLDDNFGINEVRSVDFRIKRFGWICPVMKVTLKNNKDVLINSVNDPFFKAYFNGYFARNACLNCRFADFPHQSDITLGDFWKIEQYDPSWNDNKGTSMLVVNNERAHNILTEISASFKRLQRVPSEWIRKGQHNRTVSPANKKYFEYLLGIKSFNDAINMAHDSVYDIGMVCVQNYRNFGSAFTNYALFKTLQKMKKSVYIITQPLDSKIQPGKFTNFERFKYPDFSIAPSKNNTEHMRDFNRNCKRFIVGSDQLFNYEIYKNISGFIKLGWVNDNIPKAAYAASFGIDRILGGQQEIADMKAQLARFRSFSVREKDSAELVNKTFDINAETVLDPVFLPEKSDYMELVNGIETRQNVGVFSYILDPCAENERIINTVSETLGMPVTSLTDMWISSEKIKSMWSLPTTTGVSNEKWLKMLMESSFVITDSFHAVCFSLIFHKPFLVVPNKLRGDFRARSILRSVGIEERIYSETTELTDKNFLMDSIDYNRVDENLAEQRKHSLEYLKMICG